MVEYEEPEKIVGDKEYPNVHINKTDVSPAVLRTNNTERESRKALMASMLSMTIHDENSGDV